MRPIACALTCRGIAEALSPDVEPLVDGAIEKYMIEMNPDDPHWHDVVTALCKAGEYRLAEIAQRHAVPVLQT